MDRRTFIATTAATAATSFSSGPDARSSQAASPPLATSGTLCNRVRATQILQQAGLDAVLVTLPLNVYYATNAVPVLDRFTALSTTAAIIPKNPGTPVAFISGGFEYYAGASDSGLAEGVVPYLVGGGFGSPDPHSSPAFAYAGNYASDAREQRRRSALTKAGPLSDSFSKAMSKAITDMGLQKGAFGADSPTGLALLATAAPSAKGRDAQDLFLHVRLIKTPAELALIKQGASANVEAAIVAAKSAREEGGVVAVRRRFYREAAARGNMGVYGSVDLVIGELTDGAFRDGQAFMIDFVSHYGFYQGDYGRTVSFGKPDPVMKRAADVGIAAWKEIRSRLRPGLKFSEIHQIGNDTVRRMGESFVYAFNPHSVGLQHWDQPVYSVDGKPHDLALEAGMILSVDCPLLNAGVNGTTHMEDLVVITTSGSELIHRESDGWIEV